MPSIIYPNSDDPNDRNNIVSSSSSSVSDSLSTCNMCGKRVPRSALQEVEVYYRQGQKMLIANLCDEIQEQKRAFFTITPVDKFDNCYYKYFQDTGFTLIVAGWATETYEVLKSVYISSLIPGSLEKDNNVNLTALTKYIRGGQALPFTTAIKIAYTISDVVKQYITAIDRTKVPDVFDLATNKRLWPLRYKLSIDPMIEELQTYPPVFRWNCHSSYYNSNNNNNDY